ncbi:unnamed protein product [Nezara viridula]|uniref:Amino acid transporter transmembrane domain-containing protein n=2 Tax=Nezara viridula TaxID=85310 RepID=A0A9P0E403_NEZVI|nr:unnamed protein product [Nezara viridula]
MVGQHNKLKKLSLSKMDTNSMAASREQLTINIKEEKMGYDNPAMAYDNSPAMSSNPAVKCRKISNVGTVSQMIEKNTNNGVPHRKESLKAVYVSQPNPIRQTKSEKEYEPYDNRDVKHPTTYFETFIHMLKASLGTGILAMPDAFHNAGYLVATIGTLVIGFLCTYTIHILISAEYELCKRKKQPSMTYPETAEAAFSEGPKPLRYVAKYVPTICNVFLLLYQIGSCCIYVVFISSNIKDVVDQYQAPENRIDIRWYSLFLLTPLILINWVRNLKYLAPLSSIANAVTIFSFGLIFYYMFASVPDIETRQAVAPFKRLPLFFGTVLFAMEAIGVVMPLENEMKNPRKFGSAFGVLNCAMLPITLLYTFVGFFGYLKYGNETKGSITLNLPTDQYLAQAARLMLAFAIFITHALACYVAVDISWREYIEPKVERAKVFWEYLVRTVLVIITFTFAVAIPDLELFISLIGAFCLSTMGLSFPAIIQLCTYWNEYNGLQFIFFFLKNLTICLIATFGFIIGVTTSVEGIIEKFFLQKE